MAQFGRRARLAILFLPLLVAIPALLIHGPLRQDLGYHVFADQRSWLGIPNAENVLTNALFLLVGVLGFGFVLGGCSLLSRCSDAREALACHCGGCVKASVEPERALRPVAQEAP